MPFFARGARTTRPAGTVRQNRIRGLRFAINNPRTTRDGRHQAERDLHHMGATANRPTLGTRIRHMLRLPGKSHGQRGTTHHTTHTTHTHGSTVY